MVYNKNPYKFSESDVGLVEKWLNRFTSAATRNAYFYGLAKFTEWYQKPLQTFLDLSKRDMADCALAFQRAHEHARANTVLTSLRALSSFTNYHKDGDSFKLGRNMVHSEFDLDSHIFRNGDLTKMFEAADLQGKALVATFASLGWEQSAVLGLERGYIEKVLARAKSENDRFAFIHDQRHKTGVPRYACLSPLALEYLEKWLNMWKGKSLFKITTKTALNRSLQKLAKRAGIVATGRVHSHLFRGWTMSQLTRAGWNEFLIKYYVGKAIGRADQTYLRRLEEDIETRFRADYDKYLNILPEKIVQVLDVAKEKEIEELKAEVQRLKTDQKTVADTIFAQVTQRIELWRQTKGLDKK